MYWPTDSSITELNITGGQKYNYVFAGYRAYGTVSGHTVTVSRADPAVEVAQLFGGVTPTRANAETNIIENNHVIVYGGKIHGDVSGGSAVSESGGTAIKNTVYINAEVSGDDFTVKGSVFGGFSNRNGNVTGNSVSLINGKVINDNDTGGEVIGGYVGQDGNAGGDGEGEGNTVSISGGTVARSVYGGYVYNGTGSAIKNEVTISGGTVTGAVFGGYIAFGGSAIEKNKVNIDTTVSATNVTVNNSIYGGYSNPWATTTSTISGNEVLIRGSKATVNSSGSGGVFGGYSSLSGTVSKNTVTIGNGANINAAVYGGYSKSGTVGGTAEGEGNTVTINNSYAKGSVLGGWVTSNGDVIGNTVTISGRKEGMDYTVINDVLGGYVGFTSGSNGDADSNTVTISDAIIQGDVYGGKNGSGNLTRNQVIISGDGTKINDVFGGYLSNGGNNSITVGGAENLGNSVIISGGTIRDVFGGRLYGTHGGSSYNKVDISGGTVRHVFGVYDESGIAAANNNTVTVRKGTDIPTVTGTVYGVRFYAGPASADLNKVSISDATVSGDVYGASVKSGNATRNEVTISDGATVNSAVYSGSSVNGIAGGTSEDEGNKVTISGSTVKNAVYGGLSSQNSAGGNTVAVTDSRVTKNVIAGYSGLNVANSKVSGNHVSIIGTDSDNITQTGDVYGGYGTGKIDNGNVVGGAGDGEGNTVTLSGYTKTGHVYGGYSNSRADTVGNTVTITGGETGQVFGGDGALGSANGNKVIIDTMEDGATVVTVMDVYGGHNEKTLSGNEVVIRGSKTTVTGSGSTRDTGTPHGVYGGGTVSGGTVSGNVVTISDGATVNTNVYGGRSTLLGNSAGEAKGNKVIISDGATVNPAANGFVYGGYSVNGDAGGTSEDEGNTVTVTDSNVSGFVIGGRTASGNANYNNATVIGSLLDSSNSNKFVQGGRSDGSGTANFNTVTINGSTITASGSSNYASVYGGRSTSGQADSNTVTIIGSTITTSGSGTAVSIYGGASDNQTTDCNNNTVNLLGASVLDGKGSTNIYGSNETAGTGNELHIGGVKGSTATSSDNIWTNNSSKGTNKVSQVSNFDKIVFHDVAWSTSVPALYAGAVSNVGTLDITNLKLYDGTAEKATFTADEVMDLLKSDTDLSALKLKYNSNPAETVTTDGVTMATRNNTNWTAATDLTFSGDQTDKVKLNNTGKAVVYSVAEANTVASAVLSATLAWNPSDAYAYYKNEKNTFSTGTTFDLSDLKITSDSALTENPVNETMALISGGVLGTITNQPTAVPSMDVSVIQANVVLDGTTSSGTAAISDGKLTYKVTGVTLSTVTVNGTENGAVPDGWVAPAGADKIEVTAGAGYTAPTAAATILSGTDALQFTETNTNIADDIKYKIGAAESEAAATNGTTLTYAQSKGIKADGTNLVYAVGSTKDVTTITLGKVKDPRDMSGTDFDFAGTTKVDASNLELDITPSLDVTSPIVPLVTNAANLKTGVTVDYGTGKSNHSQDFSLTHGATGIGVGVTMTGIVATMAGESAGTVNYVATGATMNSLDLANWNGTDVTEDMSKVKGKAGGVTVTTGSFAEPTTVGKGEHIDIITTTTANFFGEVTGDKTFTEEVFADDTAKGVTLSGNKFGGVKATNDNKVLTYYGETMGVENVAFGTMDWGTGRAATAGYDFTKVTAVDASGLEFTKPEEVTGSMDLLTNATNLLPVR